MKKFSDFHLPKALADSLEQMQFDTPTPIQEQAIPHALDGRDILGSAQTGTGKTAAFMIPVLAKLLTDETAQALVMSPTRELATQIMDMTRKLMGHKSGIRTALLIGGEPMFKQFKQLSARPRLIIGTPGRIDDHCRRNKSLLDTTHTLVLDEADRMLDMGFSVQIDSILKYMPAEKHTLMFSATFSDKIIKFAQRYLNNPVRVAVKAEKITADKIKHDVVQVKSREDKYTQLLGELEARQGSVIIFVKTRRNADQLSKKLCDTGNENFRAEPIHGDLRQRQRDRTIKGFHSKQFRILVATDVASRGLDIPHIEHVINYDLPQNPEDYVHRIGRTARAGAEGQAICFVTPSEGRDWAVIQRIVFPHMAPPQNDNRGSKSGDFKKSYAGKGRGKPSFRSDNGAQGNRSDRPRGDRPRQWENREKPANRDSGPEKREDRFEGNSERPKKRLDQSDNRSENRSERPARTENRSENRYEQRSDRPKKKFGHSDNRSENRSDRPARPENRSENRYEPRGDRPAGKFGGRTDNRDGNRDNKRADNRPDNRGNRFENRSDNRPDDRGNRVERQDGRPDDRGNRFKKREGERGEFRGGDAPAKRRPQGENRSEGFAPARSDKRTDRSQGFKKSEGRAHDGQKHEGARKEGARKPDGGFKKSGGFAGKKKGGFSKQTGSFKRAG